MSLHKKNSFDQLKNDTLRAFNSDAIMHHLGAEAISLLEMIERTEYAEIDEDGFIEFDSSDERVVPVVLLDKGQRVSIRAADAGMVGDQVRASAKLLSGGMDAAEDLAYRTTQFFTKSNLDKELTMFNDQLSGANAFVSKHAWAPFKNSSTVLGRPVVAFNAARPEQSLNPAVLLHEAVHVRQALEGPILRETPEDINLRNELEAYYISAQIVLAFLDSGVEAEVVSSVLGAGMDRFTGVKGVIESVQPQDKFEPSTRVRHELVRKNLAITKALRDIQRGEIAA